MTESSSFNVWQHKPWWCQPWSILLTGISLIGGSWWMFQRVWITALIAAPVLVWMGFFLLVYPHLLRQIVQQQQAQANPYAPTETQANACQQPPRP